MILFLKRNRKSIKHIKHINIILTNFYLCFSSQTCPQCRKKATENSIYKVFFTFSESETASENGDSSSLQGRIESLQFQLLMKESNIKRYTSKNVTLEKQNAGLRQEVRKVESEINQKNATIHILKEQITYFKEKYGKYKVLTQKLSQKEKELEQFQKYVYLCQLFVLT